MKLKSDISIKLKLALDTKTQDIYQCQEIPRRTLEQHTEQLQMLFNMDTRTEGTTFVLGESLSQLIHKILLPHNRAHSTAFGLNAPLEIDRANRTLGPCRPGPIFYGMSCAIYTISR